MYVTGGVLLPFFSFMTFLIAVPTGVKFFNWIGTMWKGSLSFETPMLWSIGFLITFPFGGLTGVILASPPMDFHVSDSYFVVAHFHYVVFGTVVFAMFAGFHFWWPKMTGKMLDERLGKITFWTLFVGFHGTFLVQHWLGAEGMPRRYADYLAADGFTTLNTDLHASARSCSACRSCRSSTTCGRPPSTARRSRSTTRGATAARWSGRPPARRRGTTSSRCRASAPNPRPSTCTTRRSPRSTQLEHARPRRRRRWPARMARRPASEDPGQDVPLASPSSSWRQAIVYGVWSKEPAGTTALFLAFGLCIMIGFYLAFTARRATPGRRTTRTPTSRTTPASWASSARTAGSRSRSAIGGALAFLGIIFGWWLLYFSLPVILIGLFGWVFEYYRGENRTQ